ncbi:methyltransferase, FkbM family [Marinobacter sp. DSM 26671]|uniref:FkbM family methyltransferase n=1 Tax=Marinobacter sp. DSM 26671 TaxID=1761793 RepID=UPI0008EE71FC|nr:FkbM family methyltransferase [Marinobacter sp. DSM 26671]SFD90762.1 methyltransferase, FkbM family [Marinobacter sp. DSM 26671]
MKIVISKIIVRYFKNWPLLWRLVPVIQQKSRSYSGKNIPKIVRTRYGFKINVNLGDFIGRHIYLHGDYEDYVSRIFLKLLEPGNNVIDIGANIGYFSLLSSSIVGKTGQVFSFEASPAIYNRLKSNIQLNNVDNVYACSNAIGDEECNIKFFEANDTHLGLSSLRDLGLQDSKIIDVKMVTLNKIAPEFPFINLIKRRRCRNEELW